MVLYGWESLLVFFAALILVIFYGDKVKPLIWNTDGPHWYYRIKKVGDFKTAFYLFRRIGKPPIEIYNVYLIKRGINYFVQDPDLIVKRVGKNIIVESPEEEVSKKLGLPPRTGEPLVDKKKIGKLQDK